MKRFMYLILVGIITCTVGCQKNNTVMVPIEDSVVENNEDDSINSSEEASEDNQHQLAYRALWGQGHFTRRKHFSRSSL